MTSQKKKKSPLGSLNFEYSEKISKNTRMLSLPFSTGLPGYGRPQNAHFELTLARVHGGRCVAPRPRGFPYQTAGYRQVGDHSQALGSATECL
jgi:hypothetical protein